MAASLVENKPEVTQSASQSQSPSAAPPATASLPLQRQEQLLFWMNFCGWHHDDDVVVDLRCLSTVCPEHFPGMPYTWTNRRGQLGFDRVPKRAAKKKGKKKKKKPTNKATAAATSAEKKKGKAPVDHEGAYTRLQLVTFRRRVQEKIDGILSRRSSHRDWQEKFMVRAAEDGKWYRAMLVGPYEAPTLSDAGRRKVRMQQGQPDHSLTACYSEDIKTQDGNKYTLFCRQVYDQLKEVTQRALQSTWTTLLTDQLCAVRRTSTTSAGTTTDDVHLAAAAAAAAATPVQPRASAPAHPAASAAMTVACARSHEMGGTVLREEMATLEAVLHDPRMGIVCALSHDMELPLLDQVAGVAVYRCHPDGPLPFVELISCAVSKAYALSGLHANLVNAIKRHARQQRYSFVAARGVSPLAAFPGLPNPDEPALLGQGFVFLDNDKLKRKDRDAIDCWATADAVMMRSDSARTNTRGAAGAGDASVGGDSGGVALISAAAAEGNTDFNEAGVGGCHTDHGLLVCML